MRRTILALGTLVMPVSLPAQQAALGDSLAGSVERRMEGPYAQHMEPQPVSGRRHGK
jgi:hypothetical protein